MFFKNVVSYKILSEKLFKVTEIIEKLKNFNFESKDDIRNIENGIKYYGYDLY